MSLDFFSYYSLLTQEQLDSLERIQRRATKIILNNYELSYEERLFICDMRKLSDRWKENFIKFALNLEKNENIKHWFPHNENQTVDLRVHRKYILPKFKTERYKNSPKNKVLSVLNEYYTVK